MPDLFKPHKHYLHFTEEKNDAKNNLLTYIVKSHIGKPQTELLSSKRFIHFNQYIFFSKNNA